VLRSEVRARLDTNEPGRELEEEDWTRIAAALPGKSVRNCKNWWTRHGGGSQDRGPRRDALGSEGEGSGEADGSGSNGLPEMSVGRVQGHVSTPPSLRPTQEGTERGSTWWTAEEEAALLSRIAAIEEETGVKLGVPLAQHANWREIAAKLGRTVQACIRQHDRLTTSTPRTETDRWTRKEVDVLLSEVRARLGTVEPGRKLGEEDWTRIAAALPGKNVRKCQLCWKLHGDGSKGPQKMWTAEERAALISRVNAVKVGGVVHGASWSKIAEDLGRTVQACRWKYRQVSKRRPPQGWTKEEESVLRSEVRARLDKVEPGRELDEEDWTRIAAALPGKSVRKCKNWWTRYGDESQDEQKYWTAEESAALLSWFTAKRAGENRVEMRVTKGWNKIAEDVGRTVRACKVKYQQLVTRSSHPTEWTDEEMGALISTVQERLGLLGPGRKPDEEDWTKIASLVLKSTVTRTSRPDIWDEISKASSGKYSRLYLRNKWRRMKRRALIIRESWTEEERAKLAALVSGFADFEKPTAQEWREITKVVPGRSTASCKNFLAEVVVPGVRKSIAVTEKAKKAGAKWTPAEEASVVALVVKRGRDWAQGRRWTLITDALNGKRRRDVVEWWNSQSALASLPRVKDTWTAEEEDFLWTRVAEVGPAWDKIAGALPGKDGRDCMLCWMRLYNARWAWGGRSHREYRDHVNALVRQRKLKSRQTAEPPDPRVVTEPVEETPPQPHPHLMLSRRAARRKALSLFREQVKHAQRKGG